MKIRLTASLLYPSWINVILQALCVFFRSLSNIDIHHWWRHTLQLIRSLVKESFEVSENWVLLHFSGFLHRKPVKKKSTCVFHYDKMQIFSITRCLKVVELIVICLNGENVTTLATSNEEWIRLESIDLQLASHWSEARISSKSQLI